MAIFSMRTTKLVLVPCLLIWMLLMYDALVRRRQLSQLRVKTLTVLNDRHFNTSPVAIFNTSPIATVNTSPFATFSTSPIATVNTSPIATFNTSPNATFNASPIATVNASPIATLATSAVSSSETSVTSSRQRSPEQKHRRYLSKINTEEKRIMFDLAAKFVDMCTLGNITHFMYGGTLLGSYRHHDLIPWDDDIDVLVNVSQRVALYQALAALSPLYEVADAGPRLKFFSSQSNSTSSYAWKWPYIDICFFKDNATHVGDSSGEFSGFVFLKSITFPLHARPLGPIYMNAPFDSYATLLRTYDDLHLCASHHYSHKNETGGAAVSKIPCARLRDSVPFVHRSASNEGIRETLMMRGESIIHSMVVDEPRYAVVSPFTLDLP